MSLANESILTGWATTISSLVTNTTRGLGAGLAAVTEGEGGGGGFGGTEVSTMKEVVGGDGSTVADDEETWLLAVWWMWMIGVPLLCIPGTFGNVMSAVVIQKIEKSDLQAHGIFLTALAVSDTFTLLVGAGNLWSQRIMHLDIVTLHRSLCKAGMMLIVGSMATSAWLLVGVSVVRVVAVVWPHKVHIFIGRREAWVIVVTIIVFMALVHAHFAYGFDLVQFKVPAGHSNGSNGSASGSDHGLAMTTLSTVLSQVSGGLTTDGAPGLLAGSSGSLVTSPESLFRSADTPVTTEATSAASETTEPPVSVVEEWFPVSACIPTGAQYGYFLNHAWFFLDAGISSILPFLIILASNIVLSVKLRQAVRRMRERLTSTGTASHKSTRDERMTSTIVTVLAISTVFLTLTLPWKLYMLLNGLQRVVATPQLKFFTDLIMLLYFGNNAVNFYIYCLTGSTFRNEFLRLMSCGRYASRRRTSSSSNSGGSGYSRKRNKQREAESCADHDSNTATGYTTASSSDNDPENHVCYLPYPESSKTATSSSPIPSVCRDVEAVITDDDIKLNDVSSHMGNGVPPRKGV